MSWIRDNEAPQLLNLDHADKVSIEEVSEQEGEPEKLFGLAVWMAGDDEPDIIFVGPEDECKTRLEAVAIKLPLIKGEHSWSKK